MPAIQFLETRPTPSGSTVPASGVIVFTPTAAFNGAGSGEEVLPSGFQVALDATGSASVTLAVTGGSWVWRVDKILAGVPQTTSYVSVKSTDTQWTSLTRVDPSTLTAVAASPAWVAMANSTVTTAAVDPSGNLIFTRTDGSTVNAGTVATPTLSTAMSIVFGGF